MYYYPCVAVVVAFSEDDGLMVLQCCLSLFRKRGDLLLDSDSLLDSDDFVFAVFG